MGVGVASLGESINMVAQLLDRGEACAAKLFRLQDAEPYFHHVQPRSMGRRIMELDVLATSKPRTRMRKQTKAEPRCRETMPVLETVKDNHRAACWFMS